MTIGSVSLPPNLDRTLKALQTVDRELAKKWRQESREKVAKPWAAELARQAPKGSKGAAAGRSIRAGTGRGVIIYAGRGQWQGWQPFFATNFGMHQDYKHQYIRRNRRNAGRHFVRRRVGRWAPEWIGPPHDYWFYRYWLRNEPRIRSRIVTLTNEFMEEHL